MSKAVFENHLRADREVRAQWRGGTPDGNREAAQIERVSDHGAAPDGRVQE